MSTPNTSKLEQDDLSRPNCQHQKILLERIVNTKSEVKASFIWTKLCWSEVSKSNLNRWWMSIFTYLCANLNFTLVPFYKLRLFFFPQKHATCSGVLQKTIFYHLPATDIRNFPIYTSSKYRHKETNAHISHTMDKCQLQRLTMFFSL